MVRVKHLAFMAGESRAKSDYKTGYGHGINNLNPPNPDDLSDDYWRGYGKGQRDAFATQDYYPDSNESKGF